MSFLPKNGRVIIVDDQIEQALPLINFFSKQKVSFTYFDGKSDSLPKNGEGFDDLRLIFLDVNLDGNQIPDHNTIRSLQGRIKRLVNKVIHPYILVMWTRHEQDMESFRDSLFTPGSLKNKKPIEIIFLEKTEYFDLDGKFSGKSFEDLGQALESKLSTYPEILCILNWENAVHQATNEVASLFFPEFEEYEVWSKATKEMFCKFAEASLGKHFKDVDEAIKINGAFEVLHQLFIDELESKFYNQEKPNFLADTRPPKDTDFSVNTRLLIETTSKSQQLSYPGSIIKIQADNSCSKLEEVLNFQALNELVASIFGTKKFDELTKAKRKETKQDFINNILQDMCLVQISIDPLCDFIQKKLDYSKCVECLLLPRVALEAIDNRSEALYISPVFKYNEQDMFLVFKFKTLKTIKIDEINNRPSDDYLFRIRGPLLAEIQSRFARYISRQGLLCLN